MSSSVNRAQFFALALLAALLLALLGCSSTGRHRVSVPNVVGLSEGVAVTRMSNADLRVVVIRRRSRDGAGLVVRQDPSAGVSVKAGTTVNILVEVR
ncbi:PASTA domain-containing protein [Gaiella sp.]|uniref:PASTA domain-containing protein n=1 Tax=Gaiella sp. TaxID=2663207 RepID=UPI003C729D3D